MLLRCRVPLYPAQLSTGPPRFRWLRQTLQGVPRWLEQTFKWGGSGAIIVYLLNGTHSSARNQGTIMADIVHLKDSVGRIEAALAEAKDDKVSRQRHKIKELKNQLASQQR